MLPRSPVAEEERVEAGGGRGLGGGHVGVAAHHDGVEELLPAAKFGAMCNSAALLADDYVPASAKPPAHGALGVRALVSLLFFTVSGGPIGTETIVSSCGPLAGVGAVVLFALVFSTPQALVTAELTTAFPGNGGNSLWVQAAFGNFWGVFVSYLSLFSAMVDMALYPILLYSTLRTLVHGAYVHPSSTMEACYAHNFTHLPASPASGGANSTGVQHDLWRCMLEPGSDCAAEYALRLALLLIFTLPNLVSPRFLGAFLATLGVITLLPFALLCGYAASRFRLSHLIGHAAAPPSIASSARWANLLGVVFWNLTGFDQVRSRLGSHRSGPNEPQRAAPPMRL